MGWLLRRLMSRCSATMATRGDKRCQMVRKREPCLQLVRTRGNTDRDSALVKRFEKRSTGLTNGGQLREPNRMPGSRRSRPKVWGAGRINRQPQQRTHLLSDRIEAV